MEVQKLSALFNTLCSSGGRYKTHLVHIGNVPLGMGNPIRIQSMTTTPTLDTKASVEQCKRIADAGADFVRLTAQNLREAENLGRIRERLRKEGYQLPLIADVHFNPAIAELAATLVEKIRINPGNFVRVPKEEGAVEARQRIMERLVPLIEICKRHKTALRLGINHGSLANRIVEKYGDTPEGMVVSAMEFLEICSNEDFHEVVLSMKSSNARIMVHAYRLLVAAMAARGEVYPLHLGITEAGEGLYGRIKSITGIAALLADGFGDTIRVSLTEPPENEIPVARYLASWPQTNQHQPVPAAEIPDLLSFNKREVDTTLKTTLGTENVVIASEKNIKSKDPGFVPDLIFRESASGVPFPASGMLIPVSGEKALKGRQGFPLFRKQYPDERAAGDPLRFIEISPGDAVNDFPAEQNIVPGDILIVTVTPVTMVSALRSFLRLLELRYTQTPVILRYTEESYTNRYQEDIFAIPAILGPLFLEGVAEGIWIDIEEETYGVSPVEMAFDILQAARIRFSQPEYISCPSCGRTLFDIQKVSAEIRNKTRHLKGLKIGIMGCIVNGPGEMADADYGYVGSGPDKVTLYRNRKVVRRNIPATRAVDELLALIQEYGDWRDP